MIFKKILVGMVLFSFILQPCLASGYRYADAGGFYTNVTVPACLPKNNANEKVTQDSSIVPVANVQPSLVGLKVGESKKVNVLHLVETGSSGIMDAARNGNIKKIHYVEQESHKIYIPIVFIPVYAKLVTTKVYGE